MAAGGGSATCGRWATLSGGRVGRAQLPAPVGKLVSRGTEVIEHNYNFSLVSHFYFVAGTCKEKECTFSFLAPPTPPLRP